MKSFIYFAGYPLLPKGKKQRALAFLMGLFGALTMLTAFSCVKFMPVSNVNSSLNRIILQFFQYIRFSICFDLQIITMLRATKLAF